MFKMIEIDIEEFKRIDKWEKNNHSTVSYVVTDIVDKNKYLITHCNRKGGILFDGVLCPVNYVYNQCVSLEYIKRGELLNICCCYGATINIDSLSNINIINNTNSCLYIARYKAKTKGYLVMHTDDKESLLRAMEVKRLYYNTLLKFKDKPMT